MPSKRMSRRQALALGGAAMLSGCAYDPFSRRRKDAIRLENQKPGTKDWMLSNTRIDPATKYRCPWIEGFCSHASIKAGEKLSFHGSTNPASPFRIDIYRMGFYGGTGGRLMESLGPFRGKVQPDPPIGP